MPTRFRYIPALGVLFILIAAGQAAFTVTSRGVVPEAGIDFVLISLSGVLLLYVGNWLSNSDLDPALFPRIAIWCLGGVGVMGLLLVLRSVHPGVTAEFSLGTRAISLAIGSVAGLGIGINEAQALTREQEVTHRNEQLNEIQRRLERRNGELTRTQGKLEDANERLKASNDRLDQFASAAAHDLQEPLRMISRYLGLLDDRYDDIDDDAEEFIAFAVDGADRMQVMVDDLLTYSRVETNGKPLEPVELDAVLADALTDLQVRIDETDAEITADPLPRVRGDASQLRQVFQNLLSNAIEYSGDEPPRITVEAERDESEWTISVRDDGIGIDPDERQRVFEMFQRLHAVDEHGGSGMGLALCRRIVVRHDGDIWVDSEPGNGSTFRFTVAPCEESAALSGISSEQ
ncbi:sensor histidine kinase [Halosolutus halophilus]|uniref:sensor histidine kinase n=1 Tax=Halosolutus halophilus TaxID=1552990 RepID=UPI002234FDD1|nr:ATP-binding protein [Halosolutus halophilus]